MDPLNEAASEASRRQGETLARPRTTFKNNPLAIIAGAAVTLFGRNKDFVTRQSHSNDLWKELDKAVKEGDEETATVLLDRGADVNGSKEDNGWSVLHQAIWERSTSMVNLLLQRGANPNAKMNNGPAGWTVLHEAAKQGTVDIAELLLQKNANPDAKAAQELGTQEHGWTVLRQAVKRGNIQMIQLLLDKGADPNLGAENGWTPLHEAAYYSNWTIAKLLLNNGAKPNAERKSDGLTVLGEAIKKGSSSIVELLLSKGAVVGNMELDLARKEDRLIIKLLRGSETAKEDRSADREKELRKSDDPIAQRVKVATLDSGVEPSPAQSAVSNTIGASKNDPLGLFFFDGESASTEDKLDLRASRFFHSFDKFRQQHITPKIKEKDDGERVKIAILDTGIDKENIDVKSLLDDNFSARKGCLNDRLNYRSKCEPIKGVASFTGVAGDEKAIDTNGHGTHMAYLLLKTAPYADLYVAKVSCSKHFDNSDAIVKAIDWALEKKVDIITMSFGSSYVDQTIEQAIRRATSTEPHETILFAAASNSGPNSKRTFPALHKRVIGVHSLDGLGNDNGGLNPSAKGYHDHFGTLGLGINMSWQGKTQYKSGSSYAAPIAAGIAANCLEWLDYMKKKGMLRNGQYDRLRGIDGMIHMFEKQSQSSGDLLSVTPWELWKENSLDQVKDGEKARAVDVEADATVLGVLVHELPPVKWKDSSYR